MHILITGAYGFIGSNLIRSIESDLSEIIAIDVQVREEKVSHESFTWDDIDKISLEESGVFIHLAGLAHDTKNILSRQNYYEVNVRLTQKIFDYFINSGAGKFIFFSSVKAVADSVNSNVLSENHIPDPKTPYGQSKLAAEQYILEQKLPEGKKVYILRPCMIHGPGNKGNLNLLYNIVQKGIPYPLGAFQNSRSFTSIENLVFIIREIIDGDIEPGIYNVADDEPVSTNEIVELMASSMNINPRIWKVPKTVITGIAKTGDLTGLPLNSERLKKLTESYVVSNTRLKSALGVSKMPVSALDGLTHTFASFAQ